MFERSIVRWRRWLGLGAALFGLNLALSFHNVWPTLGVTMRPELSVEIAVLVLLMAILTEWRRPPSRRAIVLLTLVLLVLVIGRYADVTAPALYGRRINLYWDARHVPGVIAMLAEAASWWQILLVVSGSAVLLTLLFLALHWMLSRTVDALVDPIPRRILLGLSGLLVLLFVAGQLDRQWETRRWFSSPVMATYVQQLGFIRQALTSDASLGLDVAPLPESDLKNVAGADILLVFLESYGAITLDRPEYAQALAPSRQALARSIERTGRQVVSARVRSSTFGSGSWLAHASLLAGIEIADGQAYKLLLTRQRETLVHRFASHGYRVLGLMPGLRQAWPEGGFYGFDKVYDATTLEYRGPEFGWWRIPDQYALARLDALELSAPERQPLFVVFPTITSHAPFRPVAPYQPDWRAMLGPEPFGPEGAAARLKQKPDWTNLGVGYVEAVDYALKTLTGFLDKRAREDLVLIVLGDHQPPSSVSGQDASWDVPVHIIASRPPLIDALREQGFEPGLEPGRPTIGPMSDLAAKLLSAFDTGSTRIQLR